RVSTKPEPSGGDAFDIIIVGAGAAGLSLAYHLAQSSLADRRILLLEPDRKDRDDRTWSFWSDSPTPFDALALRSWDCLLFVRPEARQTLPLRSFRYRTIRGIDFYRFVLDALSTKPNVRLVRASVERVEDGEGGAWVFADGACYRGRWVFDSRFRRRDLAARAGGRHALLEQHFEGWEVETDHDAFDPAAATLFDFRTPPGDGPRFFYVLPFSPRLALVEHVLTRPAARPAAAEGLPSPTAAAALRSYLEGTLGLRDYRVVRREGGVSPLTDRPFPRRLGRSVMAIGVAGGRLKPSTGYAFTRIQSDSAAIVRSLERHGEPFRVPPDRRVYPFLDAVLLRLMLRDGAAVAPVFAALFARNPPDRVLRFLDERASWLETLAIVLTLPPWRFVAVLWLWGLARLAGAWAALTRRRPPRARAPRPGAPRERPVGRAPRRPRRPGTRPRARRAKGRGRRAGPRAARSRRAPPASTRRG
ncbi:MAG TPA: lycopene cyclase family protein, partial [Polyangiaceae bacterium]|nr:lycopene cyclase family protein [Polyangiaceae bacterium]